MKLITKIVLGAFILTTIGTSSGRSAENPTPATADASAALDNALHKLNAWRFAHTNGITRVKLNQNDQEMIVTSYYLGKEFKIVSQTPDNNLSFVEFLSPDGKDVLDYIPLTGVTVKNANPVQAYVYKELAFCQELTLAKIKYFGGKLAYHRTNNLDCLVMSIPDDWVPNLPTNKPVNYIGSQEMQMDGDGKVVRQIIKINGRPPYDIQMAMDIEYVTFDREKVKAEFDKIVVKSTVDKGLDAQEAAMNALDKSAASASFSQLPTRKKVIIGILAALTLIPIGVITARKFSKKTDASGTV